MRILILTRNSRLIAKLRLALDGHDVRFGKAVNEADKFSSMSILEPGEDDFSSVWYRSGSADLIICAPYDAELYCGWKYRINDIFQGMSEHKLPVCGILGKKGRKDVEADFRQAGLTSFVDSQELMSLSRDNVEALLARLVKDAKAGIAAYDRRDDVIRRRENEAVNRRLAQEHQAKLNEAYRTPVNQRSTDQYYLVMHDQQEQSRLRCM